MTKTEATPRYTVEPLSRSSAKDQAAYVNDAVTGDVAKCFAGPDAIADAEAYAEQMNRERPSGAYEVTTTGITPGTKPRSIDQTYRTATAEQRQSMKDGILDQIDKAAKSKTHWPGVPTSQIPLFVRGAVHELLNAGLIEEVGRPSTINPSRTVYYYARKSA